MVPPAGGTRVDVDGHELTLTNLDKVLYPAAGTTKGEVIGYYQAIAPALLAHLAGRPLTLKRYPNGVDASYFYEKRCPSHRPGWLATVAVPSERSKADVPYCVIENRAGLVWVANLASLELHPSLSMADRIEQPTTVVFDLDPGAPATIVECARVGLELREVFDQLGLECFAKTSGSKGMQLYLPLNSEVTYERTKPFALAVAQLLERRRPELVVSSMKKELRTGKVLIDWSQNDEHKTTICVYSLRARPRPTVSTPLTWDEVEHVASTGEAASVEFVAGEVVARVREMGDLFAPVATLEQELPDLLL
ncbi:MAG TPA: non-homologous end-joining DNA ligase [Acidimicrobiales bacterium]